MGKEKRKSAQAGLTSVCWSGGRDVLSQLAYISVIIQILNQNRIMLYIWVSTNIHLGQPRQLQHNFVTPPVIVNKRERTECFLCSALSAVAVKKKAEKCYFKAIRNKTAGNRQKNPKPTPKQKKPHNPKEKPNTFHVLKHIRGLNFAWTQVSSLPTHILVFLKAPVTLQLNCVTALEASHINRR